MSFLGRNFKKKSENVFSDNTFFEKQLWGSNFEKVFLEGSVLITA